MFDLGLIDGAEEVNKLLDASDPKFTGTFLTEFKSFGSTGKYDKTALYDLIEDTFNILLTGIRPKIPFLLLNPEPFPAELAKAKLPQLMPKRPTRLKVLVCTNMRSMGVNLLRAALIAPDMIPSPSKTSF